LSDSVYIVIRHRNHLPIMSAVKAVYPAVYDFTTAQSQAFGTNQMVSLAGGTFGLPTGDANASLVVSTADISVAITQLNQTGYKSADVNLSGVVTTADISNMITNLNKSSTLP